MGLYSIIPGFCGAPWARIVTTFHPTSDGPVLEPHMKKKTTNFCELSVQGSIYSALCCETKWICTDFSVLELYLADSGKTSRSSGYSMHTENVHTMRSIHTACCRNNKSSMIVWHFEHRIWQSPFWILAFASTVALNCQNTSQNACHRCEKRKKSNPIRIFLWRTKISEAVCKRDWHNVRSYLFFNVWKFWTKNSDKNYKHKDKRQYHQPSKQNML